MFSLLKAALRRPGPAAHQPAELNPAIQVFCDEIRHRVEGWVSEGTPEIIDALDKAQIDLGVKGDIAEIGLHRGLFMLLLAATRRDDEMVRGFDVFERQDLNVDNSGSGSREAVETAIRTYYGSSVDRFVLHQADSLTIRSLNLAEFFPRSLRLFSVDGGHTQLHVANDLNIAQEILSPGGVAILDDFLGPHWPSVTEGFFKFMAGANLRLAPFLNFQNKLYLTTLSEHEALIEALRRRLDARLGEQMNNGHWKYVELAGYRVLSYG